MPYATAPEINTAVLTGRYGVWNSHAGGTLPAPLYPTDLQTAISKDYSTNYGFFLGRVGSPQRWYIKVPILAVAEWRDLKRNNADSHGLQLLSSYLRLTTSSRSDKNYLLALLGRYSRGKVGIDRKGRKINS